MFLEGMSAELSRCHHLLSEWNFSLFAEALPFNAALSRHHLAVD